MVIMKLERTAEEAHRGQAEPPAEEEDDDLCNRRVNGPLITKGRFRFIR